MRPSTPEGRSFQPGPSISTDQVLLEEIPRGGETPNERNGLRGTGLTDAICAEEIPREASNTRTRNGLERFRAF